MASIFDHPWLGGLFRDEEMAAIWSSTAQLASMRAFEAAWSRSLGAVGIVTTAQAETAARIIETLSFDMADLRAGTAKDGVVVPALVSQILHAMPQDARIAVHHGATSQDVIDTATALAIQKSLQLLDARLAGLLWQLAELDHEMGAAALMGRTRMQAATQITVHDRLRSWTSPLPRHRDRLQQVAPRVALLQYGGAAGDRRGLGAKADLVAQELATRLKLGNPASSWQASRDGIAEFASVLSLISGSLGKIGQDIALMSQQGLNEISLAGGGASSAMAHKQNPVAAETLVTLARFNAGNLAQMHQAMIHEQERSGAAWALEWMVLPQMAEATARATALGSRLITQITRIGSPEL